MGDLSITAASVIAGSGATKTLRTAGATLTAGKVVYLNPDTAKCDSADCDSATAAVRSPLGVALNGASNGQPLVVLEKGPVTIGATLTPGTTYYLSPNAGNICLITDLSAGDYPVIIGIATSATVLEVDILEAGVAI